MSTSCGWEELISHPCSTELQHALENWQYFSPCLGANVTVCDSQYGVWNSSCGFSKLDPERLLQADERFYLYSITKTFTAVLVMLLVEKGRVSLDDPINKYLSFLSLPSEVTIERLLNHTSGVPSYTDLPAYVPATREQPSESWSFDHVITLTCESELDFTPGEKWHYSNTGYMLLLLMIEAVSGEAYSKNIENLIVNRIGLKNTFVAEEVARGLITPGYCRCLNYEEKIEDITNKYDPWWCKTGLIVSTSSAVTKFYRSLFDGELVSASALKLMRNGTPIMQSGGPHFNNPCYGLGLMIDPDADHGGAFGHGGNGPGFNAWAVYYPAFYGRQIFITVLCNTTMGGHPFFLVKDLLRVLRNA